jgi:hypothetical protein
MEKLKKIVYLINQRPFEDFDIETYLAEAKLTNVVSIELNFDHHLLEDTVKEIFDLAVKIGWKVTSGQDGKSIICDIS